MLVGIADSGYPPNSTFCCTMSCAVGEVGSTLVIVDRFRRLGEIEIAARAILAEQVVHHYVAARLTEGISTLARTPNFARYLRDARIKRGLSVAEVADEVGVSSSSIYFWETDHCRPRDENLSALCKALKLPIRHTREMAAA